MVSRGSVSVIGLILFMLVLAVVAKLAYNENSFYYYPVAVDIVVAAVALVVPRLLAKPPGSIRR